MNLTKYIFQGANIQVGEKTDHKAKDKSYNRRVLKSVITMTNISSMAESDRGRTATHIMGLLRNENVMPLVQSRNFLTSLCFAVSLELS